MSANIHIILNPAAGSGKTLELGEPIIKGLQVRGINNVSLHHSTGRFSAESLAKYAVAEGATLIIAVGGDGTINEVINGIFTSTPNTSDITLGVVNAGTGQGFARSLRLPVLLEEQLDVIAAGIARSIDIGRLEYTVINSDNANLRVRYFVNECQIGIGAEVVRRTGPALKRFAGSQSFGIAALGVISSGYHTELRIQGDSRTITGNYFGMTVANGPLTGGSMQIAPDAQIDDGLLDVVCFRRTSALREVLTFSNIYSGKHIGSKSVDFFRTTHLHIESDKNVALATDGELIGTLPCKISLVPSVLNVLV